MALPIQRAVPALGITSYRRCKVIVVALAVAMVPIWATSQERSPEPIIDMHLHTGLVPDMRLGLCVPWITQFPPWDPRRPWEEIWMESMTRPPCADPIWSPGNEEAVMKETIAVMVRRNIFGVLSGGPEDLGRWRKGAPGRFIPSLAFKIGRDESELTPDRLRALYDGGAFAVLGEVSNQYGGAAPEDARMEPYWALATAYMGFPGLAGYRARLSSPYLLEEVLVKHPRLRLSVMHYGAPLVDEMIAVMESHPQVYVDIGDIQWFYPKRFFYEHLRKFVDAGLSKRVMFGSDQGDWPGVIEPAI